jgi:hypothetical protein
MLVVWLVRWRPVCPRHRASPRETSPAVVAQNVKSHSETGTFPQGGGLFDAHDRIAKRRASEKSQSSRRIICLWRPSGLTRQANAGRSGSKRSVLGRLLPSPPPWRGNQALPAKAFRESLRILRLAKAEHDEVEIVTAQGVRERCPR